MKKRSKKRLENSASPLEDYVFAYLFGDQRNIAIVAGFLKTILRLPEDEYDSFTIVNPILKRIRKQDKQGIVDVRVNTRSGRIIHVELQREKQDFMASRILFYLSSLINEQIKRGQAWDRIHAVVSIIICEHTFTAGKGYLNYYELNDKKTGEPFTNLLNLVIIELDKVPEADDTGAVWPWLKFLKSRRGEGLKNLEGRNEELKMAIAAFNLLKLPQYLYELAEYREIQRRDEEARKSYLLRTGREEGWERGLSEGRERGLSEGRERGLSEGREQGRIDGLSEGREESARKMKLKGYPAEEIADITGFSKDEIARL
jgi:predicted transposase/invertase (TIGR01784 family)